MNKGVRMTFEESRVELEYVRLALDRVIEAENGWEKPIGANPHDEDENRVRSSGPRFFERRFSGRAVSGSFGVGTEMEDRS
ncbi:MAG: hypothetical protein OXG71_09415 [Rhodospirillales bacterium]|nr:hypothetical protein [Rhodospirillales bacterium]